MAVLQLLPSAATACMEESGSLEECDPPEGLIAIQNFDVILPMVLLCLQLNPPPYTCLHLHNVVTIPITQHSRCLCTSLLQSYCVVVHI